MTEDQNRTLTDKFMLRLPDGMRDRIKKAATNNNRSMNAEIIATLEDAYPEPPNREPEVSLRYIIAVVAMLPVDARSNILATLSTSYAAIAGMKIEDVSEFFGLVVDVVNQSYPEPVDLSKQALGEGDDVSNEAFNNVLSQLMGRPKGGFLFEGLDEPARNT